MLRGKQLFHSGPTRDLGASGVNGWVKLGPHTLIHPDGAQDQKIDGPVEGFSLAELVQQICVIMKREGSFQTEKSQLKKSLSKLPSSCDDRKVNGIYEPT